MSAFRDMVEADREGVFLNLDEFADMHLVDYKEIRCSLQNEDSLEKSGEKALGLVTMTLYARTEDLPARRIQGDVLNVDHVDYTVESWAEQMGISVVALSQPVYA